MNRFPDIQHVADERTAILKLTHQCIYRGKTLRLNRMKKQNSDNIKKMANFNGPVFSDKQSKSVSKEHMVL